MTFTFLTEARIEFHDAIKYHKEIDNEYANSFVMEFVVAMKSVCENPFSYPMIEYGARRRLMKKFKYKIIYRVHDNTIYIQAVMHQKRKPDYWHYRIK